MRSLTIGMWHCGDSCECANFSLVLHDEGKKTKVWESSWANGYFSDEYNRLVQRMVAIGAKYGFEVDADDVMAQYWERELEDDEVIELPPVEPAYP